MAMKFLEQSNHGYKMIRNRTAYSFRNAIGAIELSHKKITEINNGISVITDTASCFSHTKWTKLSKKAESKPVFGIELAVSESIHAKKPGYDYWTFLAKDNLQSIHKLLYQATQNFRYVPLLTYDQANNAEGVFKIAGSSTNYDLINEDVHIALSPSLSRAQFKKAVAMGKSFCAASDNRYIEIEDRDLFAVQLGRDANQQTYPQHLLTETEWRHSMYYVGKEFMNSALEKSKQLLSSCNAVQLMGTMLVPEKPKTLEQMCIDGAKLIGCDLTDKVYHDRMYRELSMIADKKFEDYFYIIADMCQWARKRMLVGPARGSSCGSLVCYLLQITTVDPIKYGLIFERFIDVNRDDLPDIDIDFSDVKRHLVFEYMANKYGADHIARLGTVAIFRPKSSLQKAAMAFDIPRWRIDKVGDSIIERSGGDARAMDTTEDTLRDTKEGKALLEEFPEMIIAARMEGQPTHHSQHAAGIILTELHITNYVGIDARTGATHCDKKDAEELGLLKVDALGLTQLSIFEQTLEMIGEDIDFLWKIPLNDQLAFNVLNEKKYGGIFQFNGIALQSITDQVTVESLNDIVSITALGRPGPLNSGGTMQWIRVKTGQLPFSVPHPIFEKHLSETLGVVAYQEQVMNIGREIGGLSWNDVTALRKAMSKSLGKEFFDKYGDKWKAGARKNGVPEKVLDKVWDDLCLSGETKILNPFPSKGNYKNITLKQLYERGGLGPTNNNGGAKRKRQKILMWDGKTLLPHDNWGIKFSGKKKTFTLETESGNKIRATEEHKFLTPSGKYTELKFIEIGSEVMSDAGRLPTIRKTPKSTGRGGQNWWYKLKNGIPNFAEGKRYLKSMFKKCQHCKSFPYEETHHIDGDHENNSIENLIAVCRKCHKKLHAVIDGGYHKPWEKGRAIFPDKVISIEEFGEEDVYDVHMPDPHNNFLAEGIVVHNCVYGSWAFNKSHAVAYGLVSYYCCWLKAHYPVEFSAATLSHTDNFDSQLKLLRELALEGVGYIPLDPLQSSLNWSVGLVNEKKAIIGPLSLIHGVGPKLVAEILSSRARNEPLSGRAAKLLSSGKTALDNLFPISTRINELMPRPAERNIFTPAKSLINCQVNGQVQEVLVFAVAKEIKPKDENEPLNVQKRGYELKGKTAALNLRLLDDTDAIFAKVDRFSFDAAGKPIIERGRAGKAIYAIKGTIPKNFRMINVKQIRYIGDMINDQKPE